MEHYKSPNRLEQHWDLQQEEEHIYSPEYYTKQLVGAHKA